MTNEELVKKIQEGERDLLPQLWEQIRKFVYALALRQCEYAAGVGGSKGATLVKGETGLEIDDLVQSGYIAMAEAVESYDENAESSFSQWLAVYLKKHFNETRAAASGWTRSTYARAQAEITKRKRYAAAGLPIPERRTNLDTVSINAPVRADSGGDPVELEALIADPFDGYADAERQIWLQQLHEKLDEAMQVLEPDQRAVIDAIYYQGKTTATIAADLDITETAVSQCKRKALTTLGKGRIRASLEEFVDFCTPYYMKVGAGTFQNTGESAVEKIVQIRERIRAKASRPTTTEISTALDRITAMRHQIQTGGAGDD